MSKKLRFPRINNITISGRLTRDVELNYSKQSVMIAKMSLAFDKVTKDEYGNYQNQACFIYAIAFGKTAEMANEKLCKGSPVIIDGTLSINTYTDKEGHNRSNPEILVTKIYPLEKNENDSDPDEEPKTYSKQSNQEANYPTGEEDVPF